MWGNLVNAIDIIIGGAAGTLFNRSLPERFHTIVFQCMGLFVGVLGVSLALKMEKIVLCILSLLIGGLLGELLQLDAQMVKLGNWVKQRLKLKSKRFTEGFVASSLLYCVGAMAILGAIEEGTGNYPSILLTKSVMDGFSAIALSSAMGIGVAFSAFPVFIYQGAITLLAFLFGNLLDEGIIREISAIGGIMLVGLGINLLDIKQLKVVNLLPSLIIICLLWYVFA